MSELAGRHPPAPEMRSPAVGSGRAQSRFLEVVSEAENNGSGLDLQARRLTQIYFLSHATACTIAALAYGVAR